MSKKKEHLALLSKGDLHKRGACICSHGSKPTGSPCDYQKNGFDITQSRKSMYNDKKPNVDKEQALEDLKKAFLKPKRLKVWTNRFKGAAKRLEDDPKAWNVGYSCYKSKGENFKPRNHGGAGWWYPYIHNWHHLIPQSASYKFIAGDDGSDERGPWRLHALMLTEYNINCKENIVLLPLERFAGRVLGLPVHCPYDSCDHPNYTASCKSRLTQIRSILDKAITEEECSINIEKCNDAKKAMMDLSDDLFTIIKSMTAGSSIEDIGSYFS